MVTSTTIVIITENKHLEEIFKETSRIRKMLRIYGFLILRFKFLCFCFYLYTHS